MPNWAYNNEIIYGPKAEIDGLYKKLINWTSINQEENGFGLKWIGNIVIGAGFKVPEDGLDPRKSFSDLDNLQCKGSILNDFEVTDCDNGFAKISFDSETAWNDFRETWDVILKKHAPNCKYYFLSVEAGMDLYYKRDCDEHEFFPVDYFVDVYIDEETEKSSKFTIESGNYSHEDLLHIFQDFLKSDEKDLDSLFIEIEDNIEKGIYGNPENIYFKVEEFEEC